MNREFEIAIRASIEAGKKIMEVYDRDFEIEIKDDNSPLTLADKKANDIINSYLRPTGIPIISEENKQLEFATRKEWNSCWIVDPLDGTKEFIKKNGEFTVNIALVDKGIPQLGVIYVPALEVLYFGDVTSQTAYKVALTSGSAIQDIIKESEPISPRNSESNTVRVIGSRSHMNEQTKGYIQELKSLGNQIKIVSKGSSLKFCLVAEGKADIYPRFAPTMEWDTAAGHAICKAVGIKVIDQKTQKELLYNKESLLNPWFICD